MVEDGSKTKLCGTGPFVYISQDNKLDLHFYSDETYEGGGFIMKYVVLQKGITILLLTISPILKTLLQEKKVPFSTMFNLCV